MTTPHRLTPATERDAPWLESLRRTVYRELFDATWGGWDESRHLRHWTACWKKGGISIVQLEGRAAGMIQVIEQAGALEICELQIDPAQQGCGLGSRLILDVAARARIQGWKVVLSTGLKNHRAASLYERLGFARTGESDTHTYFELPSSSLKQPANIVWYRDGNLRLDWPWLL